MRPTLYSWLLAVLFFAWAGETCRAGQQHGYVSIIQYPYNYWSWMAQVLPYVEQDPLYRQADTWAKTDVVPDGDWSKWDGKYSWWPWGDFWNSPPTTPPNPALGMRVELFTCPSDSRPLLAQYVSGSGAAGYKVAFTSYLGVSGVPGDFSQPNRQRQGMLFFRSSISAARLNQVPDGTSNTLFIGERPPSSDLVWGWWFAGAGYDGSGVGDVVLGANQTGYLNFVNTSGWYPGVNCSTSYLNFQEGKVDNPCDQVHFWSFHPGGSNFAMADGSVRFLFYTANSIFPALCTRNGGEVVPDF